MEILREILKEQWMEIPMEHKRVELMETDSACWMETNLVRPKRQLMEHLSEVLPARPVDKLANHASLLQVRNQPRDRAR